MSLLWLVLLLWIAPPRPAVEVIRELEGSTGYRFLYRERYLSSVKVGVDSDAPDALTTLASALREKGLDMSIDPTRRVAYILEASKPTSSPGRIRGHIVDAISGERLPYATVGLSSATVGGAFDVPYQEELRVSYVGYSPTSIPIPLRNGDIDGLTIRLEPIPFRSEAVIVTSFRDISGIDSASAGFLRRDRFGIGGGSDAIRALQVLPSVQSGAALNEGLVVRGASPDGFQVTLDGLTVFSPTHLFGLIDSFNPDALIPSSVDIATPDAANRSGVGGGLGLRTRSGSMNATRIRVGSTSSAVDATLEGPISQGFSYLLSMRHSTVVPRRLAQWGLDVDRPASEPRTDAARSHSLSFYDSHARVRYETKEGAEWFVSAYLGGDDITLDGTRKERDLSSPTGFRDAPASTHNSWTNGMVSLNRRQRFWFGWFMEAQLGISSQVSRFSKDDFVYTQISGSDATLQVNVFTNRFENAASINEVRWMHAFDRYWGNWRLAAGGEVYYYTNAYKEISFDQPAYFRDLSRIQPEVWMDAEGPIGAGFSLKSGMRVSLQSASPRARLRWDPVSWFGWHAGVMRNHQVLNRIRLSNNVTSDLWVISADDEPETRVEELSTGVRLSPVSWQRVTVDVYTRRYAHLREHNVNTPTLATTAGESPWASNLEGKSRGLEVFSTTSILSWSLVQAYAWTHSELEGKASPWNRPHRYTATFDTPRMAGIQLSAAGTFTTSEIGTTRRLDVAMGHMRQFGRYSVRSNVTLYNVLDRKNPWYRSMNVVVGDGSVPRVEAIPTTVWDLGRWIGWSVSVTR
jgi:hypothetical protein